MVQPLIKREVSKTNRSKAFEEALVLEWKSRIDRARKAEHRWRNIAKRLADSVISCDIERAEDIAREISSCLSKIKQ